MGCQKPIKFNKENINDPCMLLASFKIVLWTSSFLCFVPIHENRLEFLLERFFGFIQESSRFTFYVGEEQQVLSWDERLQIALDISHGIEYLHEGVSYLVFHCFASEPLLVIFFHTRFL